MRALIIAACSIFVGSVQAAEPSNTAAVTTLKVSSAPPPDSRRIVEMRARSTHMFVATGYESADGTATYTSVKGFYPQGAGDATVSQMLSSPGEVTMTIKDEGPYNAYRFHVTETQARNIEHMLSRWTGTEYKITTRNCTALVNDVAQSIGLETMPIGEHPDDNKLPLGDNGGIADLLPETQLAYIGIHNKQDRPLQFAEQQARERANNIEADNIVARYTATHQKPVTGNRPDGGSSVIPSVPDVWLPPTTSGGGTSQPVAPAAPPPPPPQAKPPAPPPINKTPVENRPL
jgi:hypothetical protein